MSKHFRTNRGKPVVGNMSKTMPLSEVASGSLDPASQPLPDRLWSWMERRLRPEGAGLSRRRAGIDTLEPRLLMSGDPVTATAALATGIDTATLRVTTVDTGNNTSENRLQLIQGTSATPSSANVISEWKVELQGGANKLVMLGSQTTVDVLQINGNTASNTLVLDQSVLSLSDGVQIQISMGGGADDRIVGPSASAGLVWSLNTIDGNGADGTLSILATSGDATNVDTDTAESDKPIDARVTYAGGRDYFLSFTDVDSFEMKASRDIVADKTAAASEWGLTWSDTSTTLARFTTATTVGSTGSTASGRSTGLSISGAEGLSTTAASHVNLSYQSVTNSQTGATINAESGALSLYAASDSTRSNPLAFDVRGVTGFTGTAGADAARAAQSVSMNLLSGSDSLAGSDDQLVWTVTQRSDTGLPEASVSLGFNSLNEDGTWQLLLFSRTS